MLRSNMKQSQTERKFLQDCASYDVFLTPQYKISTHCVDFANIPLKIAIEIDGPHHNQEEQQRKDYWREHYAKKEGWVVFRYSADDAWNNSEEVILDIKNKIEERKKEIDEIPYEIDKRREELGKIEEKIRHEEEKLGELSNEERKETAKRLQANIDKNEERKKQLNEEIELLEKNKKNLWRIIQAIGVRKFFSIATLVLIGTLILLASLFNKNTEMDEKNQQLSTKIDSWNKFFENSLQIKEKCLEACKGKCISMNLNYDRVNGEYDLNNCKCICTNKAGEIISAVTKIK